MSYGRSCTSEKNVVGSSGVDAVFDPIGGRNIQRSWQTLRAGGRLIGYGITMENLAGGKYLPAALRIMARMAYWSLLPNGRRAQYYFIRGLMVGHPNWFREDLTRLFALLAEGKIKPVIAERLPLGTQE